MPMMNTRRLGKVLVLGLAPLVLAMGAAFAQPPDRGGGLAFNQYIQAVLEGNVGLAAQKFNVEIADAAIAVAGLSPDPQFTFGYSAYELSRFRLPRGITATVNFTLEHPAKREARVDVAGADKALAEAQLTEYMKSLRVDAANAFVESLRTRALLERKRRTLALFQSLAADQAKTKRLLSEERAQLGLETARLRGELHQAEADAAVSDRNLNFYLGQSPFNKPGIFAAGALEQPEIAFSEAEILAGLVEQRPDIASMRKALEAAKARSRLAHENRSLDLGLAVGVTHTQPMWAIPDAGGSYTDGSYPMSNSLSLTLSIPIPLSLRQDGDLRGPAAAATQAELRLRDLQERAAIEAQQALTKYRLSLQQTAAYREGMRDADLIVEDTLRKYRRQESGFPDIVYYVRTASEIYTAYLEAQAAALKALIGVYQVSGRWQFEL